MTHCAFIRNINGTVEAATSRGRLLVGDPDDLRHLLGNLIVEVGDADVAEGDATVSVQALLDEVHATDIAPADEPST